MEYLPVVFFTANGIPGDGGSGGDDDEAEYAWLTPDMLKPFKEGHGGKITSDPSLQESVEAAEAAVALEVDGPIHLSFLPLMCAFLRADH